MPTTKRLNDTERRTWKNKSEKLPMGSTPWAYFKFLYRHECSYFFPSEILITDRITSVTAGSRAR